MWHPSRALRMHDHSRGWHFKSPILCDFSLLNHCRVEFYCPGWWIIWFYIKVSVFWPLLNMVFLCTTTLAWAAGLNGMDYLFHSGVKTLLLIVLLFALGQWDLQVTGSWSTEEGRYSGIYHILSQSAVLLGSHNPGLYACCSTLCVYIQSPASYCLFPQRAS